jgi:hypothetical protein
MLKSFGLGLAAAALVLVARAATGTSTDAIWPDHPPALGLLQTRAVFSLAAARHLEGLVVQHEHLTGERILLVVHPWSGAPTASGAPELAQALSDRWRLDTTRRGTGVILVLQESAPGKVAIGYRPGIGLAKPQIASGEELEKLQEKVDQSSAAGAWDEIAERSTVWLLQSLASPLLEGPDLLIFPKTTDDLNRPQSRTEAPKSAGGRAGVVASLGLGLLLILALGLVVEAVRRGVKPEVLMGSERVIRFTLVDHARELSGNMFRSSRKDEAPVIRIESLEGSS